MLLHARKPQWLNKKINLSDCRQVSILLDGLNVHTVCQEASCPNIGECFSHNEATFLILGKVCTRDCDFCGVSKGVPLPVDPHEDGRIAEAVKRLSLKHVVITSVTRDDLADGGAHAFVKTIAAIRGMQSDVVIEILIPDFQLNLDALRLLVAAKPDIIGHNMETVKRLYPVVRKSADYARSLELLRSIKKFDTLVYTKSAVMVGLGEKEEEVVEVFRGLRTAGCDFLSIGQYLSPSSAHFPVQEFISPKQFDGYRRKAKAMGFRYVASGPYVRSSYLASKYMDGV
jgi:lipoic acid synthetase